MDKNKWFIIFRQNNLLSLFKQLKTKVMIKFTVKEVVALGALVDQEIEKQKKLISSSGVFTNWVAHEQLFKLNDLRGKLTKLFHETE